MKKDYTLSFNKWLMYGLITVCAVVLSFTLKAQIAPSKQWDRTFGGNKADNLNSLQQTADGGFVIGGFSNSPASGDKSQDTIGGNDYWVLKLNAAGSKMWDKTYGGSGNDILRCLHQTTDGGYIVGGYSNSGISGDKSQASKGQIDYWVIKLDGNGNKIWDRTIGGSGNDYLTAIRQTTDGGYILGGYSISQITGDKSESPKGAFDYWIVKLDANGTKLWDKTYGGLGLEELRSLQQTSDGGYILGGLTLSGMGGDKTQFSKGGWDYWVVRLDSNGSKVWDKTIGGSGTDNFYSLHHTADGGFVVGGYSNSQLNGDKTEASKGSYDYWVVKLDANGMIQWDKTIGGSGMDELRCIRQTQDGGYMLGGLSFSTISGDKSQPTNGSSDYWVVKLNATGNKQWDKTIGGNLADQLTTLQQTSDGGFLLGGHSFSAISGDKTQPVQGESDFWIVKLGPEVTGITEITASINLSVFPNPNQGKFQLQLTNLTTPTAEVTITDLWGRLIWRQELAVSDSKISEEMIFLAAKGMYLLHLKTLDKTVTRKFVLE